MTEMRAKSERTAAKLLAETQAFETEKVGFGIHITARRRGMIHSPGAVGIERELYHGTQDLSFLRSRFQAFPHHVLSLRTPPVTQTGRLPRLR